MKRLKLIPKIFTVLKEGYNFKIFLSDLSAGIVVGIVALPLSIAFAIASGVRPEQGLYTAIIAGFIISILSGSRVQIGGPTGAFIVILYGIVEKYNYDGLVVATILAGFILIVLGFLNMGSLIKFIPFPVIVGFTTGIAVVIATTQIKDAFGLRIQKIPGDFVEKIVSYIENLNTINIYAVLITIISLIILILWKKISSKIPGSIIAIIVTTVLVYLLKLPVETIGSRFDSVPNSFPMPKIPIINISIIKDLIRPAFSIAFLAGIESLLSAVVADGMTGTKHRSNMELVAQGIANIIAPIFGGIAATGAIARTATNIKNGGKTPFAGIIHAITLLLIMLFFGKYVALVPMPTLAAILLIVSYNMSESHIFLRLFKSPKSDVIVLLTTFILTVIFDLTIAIEAGIIISAFFFIYKMSNLTQVQKLNYTSQSIVTGENNEEENKEDPDSINKLNIPKGVEVFEIYGSLFFGAATKILDELSWSQKNTKILILRMRNVMVIDATGIRAIENIYAMAKKQNIILILSGVRIQILFTLQKSGLLKKIGDENIALNIHLALEKAKNLLKK